MTAAMLTLPRKLAIRLLHEAQIAQPEPIRGWVLSRDGRPAAFVRAPAEAPVPAHAWAWLWSEPSRPAVPEAMQLSEGQICLVISLNTKGVLEMRAWTLVDGAAQEIPLRAIED
jgi:hypothetical protein